MKLSIRKIIFIAVSNYLSDTQIDDVIPIPTKK